MGGKVNTWTIPSWRKVIYQEERGRELMSLLHGNIFFLQFQRTNSSISGQPLLREKQGRKKREIERETELCTNQKVLKQSPVLHPPISDLDMFFPPPSTINHSIKTGITDDISCTVLNCTIHKNNHQANMPDC